MEKKSWLRSTLGFGKRVVKGALFVSAAVAVGKAFRKAFGFLSKPTLGIMTKLTTTVSKITRKLPKGKYIGVASNSLALLFVVSYVLSAALIGLSFGAVAGLAYVVSWPIALFFNAWWLLPIGFLGAWAISALFTLQEDWLSPAEDRTILLETEDELAFAQPLQ